MRRATPLFLLFCSAIAAQDSVQFFWSGALSTESLVVKARLSAPMDSVRVAFCPTPCTNGYFYSAYADAAEENDLVATFELPSLLYDREYLYRFEVDGMLDLDPSRLGRFHTAPSGPSSYSFLVASCNSVSSHPAWVAMRQRHPLFYINPGDLHYMDPNSLDLEVHRTPYKQAVLSVSPMKEFLHEVPIAYVWDDHDFCGDGSNGSSIGKPNAARAYREYVPHYPLHHAKSVYQSFTIGRVHFILSDLRSAKSPESMMDIEQFAWLLQEFLYARDHGLIAAWISPLTWNSVDYPENWACQPEERRALNDFLYSQQVKDLFILSGDAHMLAIDDGAHSDFSTAQDLRYPYPIFQAAAISRSGSYKGGAFNQGGVFPNPDLGHGQFGEVLVDDDGENVCITFNGWRTDSMSTTISLMDTYTFCRTPEHVGIPDHTQRQAAFATWTDEALELFWPEASGAGYAHIFDATGRELCAERILWSEGRSRMTRQKLTAGLFVVQLTNGARTCVIKTTEP